jgi:hypothetical protein
MPEISTAKKGDGTDGGWTMEDGRWTMDDGGWTMDDGRWTMDDGRWTMDDGRWTMDIIAFIFREAPSWLQGTNVMASIRQNLHLIDPSWGNCRTSAHYPDFGQINQEQRGLKSSKSSATNAAISPSWQAILARDCRSHPTFPANESLPIPEEGWSIRSCATTTSSGTSAPTTPRETSPTG